MKRKTLMILVVAALMLPIVAIPAGAAAQTQIDQAIQDGLAWLATRQNSDGSFGSGYLLANTATAVLAFENEGHFPGGGTEYSDEVEKGLDYLFTSCRTIPINPQTVGYAGRYDDPDTNGNGQGVYFSQNSYMYETGLVMQAIVASNTPDLVVPTTEVDAIVGGYHSLALKADGSIVGWGHNGYGQTSPPAGNDYVAIAAGVWHSLALKADGSLVGWGRNGYGQASPPAGNDFVAVAAGDWHSLALKADGSIVGWGRNDFGQASPPAGNDFVAISAGAYYGVALKADGSIVSWGWNGYGQTNSPAGNDFVAISAGGFHGLALKADGSVAGWGWNVFGQASPPAGNDFVAISAGVHHGLALKADGSIAGWGYNVYGQASPPAGNDFVAIAAGFFHGLALKADGSIVGWGNDDYGQASGPFGMCGGMTYEEVMTDLVDLLAWAQIDGGPGRGGWRYGMYNNATGYGDNSVAQWPVLGLVAAEQWGIHAPQFVKDELEYWVTYIQHSSGGSGYHTPSQIVNVAKTGGLLVEFYYLGDDATTPRAQKAINYINSRWNVTPYGTWYGNKGHPYAMFAVFKGLELMQVPTMSNAPANPDTPAGDWWGDYAHYLVNTQASAGYWSGYGYWRQYLATPWYIVILQASVFPVSVDVVVPDSACDDTGYDVSVHYSVERFEASGTLTVYKDDVLYDTVTLTDFQGTGTVEYNIASDEVGTNDWRAELDVTGGGISVHAEDSDTGMIYDTPEVSGIPDQTVPFEPFDLDDFQTCECADADWSVEGVPAGWTVTIDAENVATVTAPEGATDPAEITFVAIFHWPGIDCVGSDTAVFSVNQPPVALAGPGQGYPDEKYHVDEGSSVGLDGTQSYDPDGDPITYAWDLDADGEFETPGATPTFSAADLDNPPTDEVYIYLKVCDVHEACDIGLAEVEIQDLAPMADFSWAPEPQDEGSPVQFTDGSTSVVDDILFWNWDFAGLGTSFEQNPSFTFPDNGVYNVCLTVTDDDDSTDTVCQDVTVDNVDPTVTLTGATSANEGDTVSYSYTVSDPGADTFTLSSESCGVGGNLSNSTFDGLTGAGSFDCTFPDGPATPGVSVTVDDDDGGSGSDSLSVTVNNVAPTVESITVPWQEPVDINDQASFTVDVTFSDPAGVNDEPYTCDFDLDYDGVTFDVDASVGDVVGTSCSTPLNYAEPGIYTVKVTVTDKDSGSGSATATEYIVIYDPDGGFVTGGGWIMSPPGAYAADPSLTGKANFGFVSKYKKGASVPTGQSEFQFKAGDLNFHSSSYDWLVIAGARAKYKGVGTINGEGNYGFMLTATDAELTPSTDVDLFRIKIWDRDTDEVVYDNQMGADDDGDAGTEIGGGNIKIHKAK